jgi:drug/metabolite transporter (DMT)-like permease
MHGHIDNATLGLGVAAGLIGAFLSTISYFVSRHHGSRGGGSLRLLVLAHVMMGIVCVPLTWLLWPAGMTITSRWLAPLVGSTVTYMLGQAGVFAALRRTDASRVAPLLGLKIAMIAGITSFLPGKPLDARQWLAVGMSVTAAAMLQRGGAVPAAAVGAILVTCAVFAMSDMCILALIDGLQRSAADAGVALGRIPAGGLAMIITYAFCGVLAVGLLPAAPVRRRVPGDRTTAACYAAVWLGGMAALYVSFGLVGTVFGAILQSTRGMMAIVMGAALAHAGWHGLESHVDRRTLVRRAAAAALMTAAIAVFMIDLS